MTQTSEWEGGRVDGDGISLFGLASILLRQRWRILRWMVLGLVVALIPVLFEPQTYTATASFVPQGGKEPSSTGLANLAGQFGISVGGSGSQSESPQFYADLMQSRVILEPIVADGYPVDGETEGRSLIELLQIEGESPAQRLEKGVRALRDMIGASVDRETGVLTVSVRMPWPLVSLAVTERLVEGVNAFNLQTRQSQASLERQFTGTRLESAQNALREAERRLQRFLQSSREFRNSPQLLFEHDRLERAVMLQQQLVMSLTQSYEEARIREVRDTPVITVIEQPAVAAQPDPRGRVARGLMGMMFGGVFGGLIALVAAMIRRRRASGDVDVEGLFRVFDDLKRGARRLVPGSSRRP